MKETLKEGLNILLTLLSLVLYIALIGCWVFYPEIFLEIPTNDLIMFVMLIIIGFMPDKK